MANFIQKTVANFANDNGKFLFINAAIGWFLASAAQTFGIMTNKKIDKEDKKFLVPQEVFDGLSNIGLYAIITAPLMNMTDKLIDKGVISFRNVDKNSAEFKSLKGGAAVLASFVGGIVSTNILTPIIRNKLGTVAQRKAFKQKIQDAMPTYNFNYQPLFRKNQDNTPLRISNYINFAKSKNLKI